MIDDTTQGKADKPAEADSLVPEASEILGGNPPAEDASPAPEKDPMQELQREAEETRQHMLRALAEAENVRRRAQRDVADARSYAITSFARDLLSVSDNFQRALAAIDGMGEDDLPTELKNLMDGVRMTERELQSVFERHGVTTLNPVGERFDPNKHQAMFEIENTEVASGTVVQVVQAGSMIGERILRPAMVGVSKGGPKPGAAPEKPAEETPKGPPAEANGGEPG
ncbi:MAG: nucleotide exchange factor GrpE [Devosia sp.]